MATVNFKEYQKDLVNFCTKHNEKADCIIYTSPMVNNSWHKEYCYSDGSTFYEINEIIEEKVEIEIHGIKANVTVKLYRTEYWSTDNSQSKFYYEKVNA